MTIKLGFKAFKRMMIQHKTELSVNHIQEAIVFVLVSAPPEGNLKPRRFLRLIIFISTLILPFAKTSACRNTEDPEETLSIKSSNVTTY